MPTVPEGGEDEKELVIACPGSRSHELRYQKKTPYPNKKGFGCDVCWKTGEKDLYHCDTCKFDAHTACAKIEEKVKVSFHPHSLRRDHIGHGEKVTCVFCLREDITPWVYKCSHPVGPECVNFAVHGACAKYAEKLAHPSHPGHELKLEDSAKGSGCNGCGRLFDQGYHYRCPDQACDFHLHPSCATLAEEPLCRLNPTHRVKLGYQRRASEICRLCNYKSDEGDWVYRCRECKVCIHFGCFRKHSDDVKLGNGKESEKSITRQHSGKSRARPDFSTPSQCERHVCQEDDRPQPKVRKNEGGKFDESRRKQAAVKTSSLRSQSLTQASRSDFHIPVQGYANMSLGNSPPPTSYIGDGGREERLLTKQAANKEQRTTEKTTATALRAPAKATAAALKGQETATATATALQGPQKATVTASQGAEKAVAKTLKGPEKATVTASQGGEKVAATTLKGPDKATATTLKGPEKATTMTRKGPEKAMATTLKGPEKGTATTLKGPEKATTMTLKRPEKAAATTLKGPEKATPTATIATLKGPEEVTATVLKGQAKAKRDEEVQNKLQNLKMEPQKKVPKLKQVENNDDESARAVVALSILNRIMRVLEEQATKLEEQSKQQREQHQEAMSGLDEMKQIQVQSTTRAVPRLVLCTKGKSKARKLLTELLPVGLKSVHLHLLCEDAKQPHVVKGAQGCEINQKVAGGRWDTLQPFIVAGLQVLTIAINVGAMGVGMSSLCTLLPDLPLQVQNINGVDLGKHALRSGRKKIVPEQELAVAEEAAAQWLISYLNGQNINIADAFKLYRIRYTTSISPDHTKGTIGWLCENHVEQGMKAGTMVQFPVSR